MRIRGMRIASARSSTTLRSALLCRGARSEAEATRYQRHARRSKIPAGLHRLEHRLSSRSYRGAAIIFLIYPASLSLPAPWHASRAPFSFSRLAHISVHPPPPLLINTTQPKDTPLRSVSPVFPCSCPRSAFVPPYTDVIHNPHPAPRLLTPTVTNERFAKEKNSLVSFCSILLHLSVFPVLDCKRGDRQESEVSGGREPCVQRSQVRLHAARTKRQTSSAVRYDLLHN